MLGQHPFHVAGKKYVDAVRLAGCTPLIVPTAPIESLAAELDALLAIADGVLLTGSASNVHPSHFDEAVHDPGLPLDIDRDAWTLPLIRRALAVGVPLFGICRGFQEANVALGGTLHQGGYSVSPLLRYNGARYGDTQQLQRIGGYSVVDLSLDYKHQVGTSKLGASLSVQNLFDKRYIGFINASYYQLMSSTSAFYYPGAPRTVVAKLTLDY